MATLDFGDLCDNGESRQRNGKGKRLIYILYKSV